MVKKNDVIEIGRELLFIDVRKKSTITEDEFKAIILRLPITNEKNMIWYSVPLNFLVTEKQHKKMANYSGNCIRYINADHLGFPNDLLVYDSDRGSHLIVTSKQIARRK